MKIILLGRPKSTSNAYKTMCRGSFPTRYMIPKARELKEYYQLQAREQYKGPPLKKRLELDITIYFDTKGRKDWDNFHKLSMDALTGIVWEDDEQTDDAHVHKRFDKDKPRIEIQIL